MSSEGADTHSPIYYVSYLDKYRSPEADATAQHVKGVNSLRGELGHPSQGLMLDTSFWQQMNLLCGYCGTRNGLVLLYLY